MSIEAPELPELPKPKEKAERHWLDWATTACALFMSALSIFMAYHTGRSMERLVHANSWPFLQFESGNNSGADPAGRPVNEIYFSVRNAGTGPARVHSLEFLMDGAAMESSFFLDEIARRCCAGIRESAIAAAGNEPLSAYGLVISAPVAPGFLSPGGAVTFLSWPKTNANQALWAAIDEARYSRRITVRACYCSVFDECWIAETNKFPPRPVQTCPAPENSPTL